MHDATIPRRWRLPLRIVWLACALAVTLLMVFGAAARWAELQTVCDGSDCATLVLSPGERTLLEARGIGLGAYALYLLLVDLLVAVGFGGLAVLLFWRKSADWIGYFASLAFLFIGTIFYSDYPRALVRQTPALEPVNTVLTALAIALFILLFYLFPDGRFVPRRLAAVVALFVALLLLDPLLLPDGPQATSTSLLSASIAAVGALLGFGSLIYRYRYVATPFQRQQMKWVLGGFVCMFVASMEWVIFMEIFPLAPGPRRLAFIATMLPQYVLLASFPLSFVIAFQRHQLWDIDIIIRRTLQYAVVTAVLALVYFGSVILLQRLFTAAAGADSPAVIVLSTLLIAALFNPLRKRVQSAIDRRFFRRKYDAQQVLAQFGAFCRDETELAALQTGLEEVIRDTLQPEHVSVWFRSARR